MKRFGFGLAMTAAVMTGCGGGMTDAPDVAPVSGIVTVKGQPRAGLNVVFHPESGGRPAAGVTGPDGKFTLTTNNTADGATIGRNKAAITAAATDDKFAESGPPMPGMPGYEQYVKDMASKMDSKYADPEKSGLLYTVPPEGLPNVEIKIP